MNIPREAFSSPISLPPFAVDNQENASLPQRLEREQCRRQQVEEALRESEAHYQAVMESAFQGVGILQNHLLQCVNPALVHMFGYARQEEMLGQAFSQLVVPSDRPRLHAYEALVVGGILPPKRCELQGIRQNGLPLWFELRMHPTLWQGQRAFLIALLDTTEQRRLERQIRQAQKLEAIGALAGGIAHDFNNLLAAILGYTELALDHISEQSPAWGRLRRVLTAGERAKELVRQILAFSRQNEQQRQPVQLRLIVKEVLKLMRASLPVTIEIRQCLDSTIAPVLADPTQMHQILMNLCINAEHSMRGKGGILEINLDEIRNIETECPVPRSLPPGRYVRLTVRDTGHGMEPDVLERIFDPFFTTKENGEGTGMGLAIVQGIVVNHGGAITVSSTAGQGTSFHLYLPLFEKYAEAEIPIEEAVPGGKECILLVDDEEPLARLGQAMLMRLGYQAVVSTNSVEALEIFRAAPQKFDLVITDYTMPVMTGEELVKELRHLRPNIPIILYTGFSHMMNAEKAHALGINAFLLKPLLLRDLGMAIRRALERQPVGE